MIAQSSGEEWPQAQPGVAGYFNPYAPRDVSCRAFPFMNTTSKNVIVGTAGHIDHGKSALVEALTGTHPDRLAEEKRRGITIDLGFAFLEENGVRFGLVDVPGHERFVSNMLAGAAGIDLVLLVIAADESIKPQTREHFDICRLLGVKRGVVALTKSDLVDADMLGLVRLEVEEYLRGSFLERAPIVPVSAKMGTGLAELKSALHAVASEIPGKDAARYFRLPIDRAFAMKGFGTVVTGTLISGSIGAEDEVELFPGSKRLRVRGVQSGGKSVERAIAGQRTAVNLAGIDHGDVKRGMTLAAPGHFRATRRIDVRLTLLPSARKLKHRARVHFHAGTMETIAEVFLYGESAACVQDRARWRICVCRMRCCCCPATDSLCGNYRRSSRMAEEWSWIRWRGGRRCAIRDARRFSKRWKQGNVKRCWPR